MFLEKTAKKVKGYIEVTVFGFFVERFLNLALRANVNLWNMDKKDDATVTFATDAKGYRKLASIAHQTGCKITSSRKKGIPFYAFRHRKRSIFLLLFLAVVAGIYWYQLHIWQIEIIGEFTFPIEELWQELEKENVKVGVLKNRLDMSYIRNNIGIRRHDIAWMGIHIKGTKATVEFIQANLKPAEEELDKVPCDIVAEKDGVITYMNVLEGTPKVQVGDTIKSGDVLISGTVTSEWAPARRVNAKGEIQLKTWYTRKEIIPLERDILSPTGKVQRKFSIGIKNYQINFGNTGTKYEKYDTIVSESKLNLFGFIELPIQWKQITYRELNVDTVKYTETQAMDGAIQAIKNELKKQIGTNGEIVGTEVNTLKNENGITVVVTMECIEKVGIRKKLEG